MPNIGSSNNNWKGKRDQLISANSSRDDVSGSSVNPFGDFGAKSTINAMKAVIDLTGSSRPLTKQALFKGPLERGGMFY